MTSEKWVTLRQGRVRARLVSKKGARAIIETNVGRINVDSADLIDAPALRSPSRLHTGGSVTVHMADESFDEEIDLHKFTVEEIEPLLSAFLDGAAVRGLRRVRIIHGKGTGKLRNEVKRLLLKHPAVTRMNLGGPAEGSYGVTVVYLQEHSSL